MDEKNNNQEQNLQQNMQDTANMVKDGSNLAKNVATGNVLGAAKDSAKLLKNKKFKKRLIMKCLSYILIPILAGCLIVGVLEAVANSIIEIFTTDSDSTAVVISPNGAITFDDEELNKLIEQYENETSIEIDSIFGSGIYSATATEEEIKEAKKEYIKQFYEAQVITQEINRGGSGLQGKVYVNKIAQGANDTSSTSNLTYKPLEEFNAMKEQGNSDIRNCFSINENGELLVAAVTTTSVKKDGSTISNNTNITIRNINYKSMISQYSTPFKFFISLGSIVHNPQFIKAVADLIKDDTQINLTVLDATTKTTTKEVYTYTPNNLSEDGESYQEGEPITETTETTVESSNPTVVVTYENTWISEQTITYQKNTTGPIENEVSNSTEEDEPAEGDSYKTNQSKVVTETTTSVSYGEGLASDYIDKLGEKEDGYNSFVGLMDVKFPNLSEKPASNMISGIELLCGLLQKSPETQNMEQVMRYALYKYTGNDYGVTKLDYSIFDVNYFEPYGGSSGLANYLLQFSHGGRQAPKSDDGRFYKMYGDGVGWPTIGNADLQWKSHASKFDIPGTVLENGVEKEVANIRTYVNSFLTKGETAEYTNKEVDAMNIYISTEVVDKIGKDVQSVYYNAVQAHTNGLSLSRQQLYALTAIQYNFGHLPERNGYTFRKVYEAGAALYELNSPEHNKFIWDNWWCRLEGGAPGHIISRDLSFETYVKGTMDFNTTTPGLGHRRNYYVYYTQQQLNRISYAPDFKVTRTAANETEIFTYVKGASSFIEAAHEVHQTMEKERWTYSVVGDLYWNNIEMSLNNPNKVTCCATYVGCALYAGGVLTEEEANSFNYNSAPGMYNYLKNIKQWQTINSYDLLEEGDIVFMTTKSSNGKVGHVQIYAGDGKWYNAGSTGAIQRANPYTSDARSRFVEAVRPN